MIYWKGADLRTGLLTIKCLKRQRCWGVGRTLIEEINTTTSPSHKQHPSVHACPALIALILDDYHVDCGDNAAGK